MPRFLADTPYRRATRLHFISDREVNVVLCPVSNPPILRRREMQGGVNQPSCSGMSTSANSATYIETLRSWRTWARRRLPGHVYSYLSSGRLVSLVVAYLAVAYYKYTENACIDTIGTYRGVHSSAVLRLTETRYSPGFFQSQFHYCTPTCTLCSTLGILPICIRRRTLGSQSDRDHTITLAARL